MDRKQRYLQSLKDKGFKLKQTWCPPDEWDRYVQPLVQELRDRAAAGKKTSKAHIINFMEGL